jgi:hypothetical protein
VNSALPSSLPLLLFFLPFTWGHHRRARATTALPRTTSLELLILFALTASPLTASTRLGLGTEFVLFFFEFQWLLKVMMPCEGSISGSATNTDVSFYARHSNLENVGT